MKGKNHRLLTESMDTIKKVPKRKYERNVVISRKKENEGEKDIRKVKNTT